jgi:hypothetical protein
MHNGIANDFSKNFISQIHALITFHKEFFGQMFVDKRWIQVTNATLGLNNN